MKNEAAATRTATHDDAPTTHNTTAASGGLRYKPMMLKP